ncbi:DNA polymerase epsilon subunit 4 isoform X2 [Lepus europaeus]|uniref:DNA polymerase epsilon subunit 4 isoform X2 n=1 Tax=Lepus europaeus TaxID=9983 RepID=UPI002B468B2C|nr:DNA polymerase epsilon subunit 4 isoform X2 [Lepus europaeus]
MKGQHRKACLKPRRNLKRQQTEVSLGDRLLSEAMSGEAKGDRAKEQRSHVWDNRRCLNSQKCCCVQYVVIQHIWNLWKIPYIYERKRIKKANNVIIFYRNNFDLRNLLKAAHEFLVYILRMPDLYYK